jgi:methylthioribose-1-phosphate isomerase
MTKPRRKEIKLSKDSILGLMQEIYNELVEQRNTAVRLQNKMASMMKDPEDLTVLGPIIKEQQKIINDTIEKKLSLSKLQSQIWEKSNNQNEENFSLSEIDDDVLQNLIGKDIDKLDDGKYHLK